MKIFRIVIFAVFALSVAVTLAVVFFHMHELHMAHELLATLTFFLIAVYLLESAELASLAALRELRERFAYDASMTIVKPKGIVHCDGVVTAGNSKLDESALSGVRTLTDKVPGDTVYRASVNHGGELTLRLNAPLKVVSDAVRKDSLGFNVCAGMLAKSGIYVKNREVLAKLAKAKTLEISGNSPLREGFTVTEETLRKMGVTLSENGFKVVLCDFRDFDDSQDVVITHNKVTHVLKALYIARVYAKDLLRTRLLTLTAALVFTALILLRQPMFAGMTVALWSVMCVLSVRRLDRKAAKLSFEKVTNKP
ncbi:MAG: hypothetical protein LBN97_09925 [Oscillospiraceae bacterium]|jgi:hypothetical protein|nr:hypothetical protein [Oscillospiraceae bacterium]